MLILLSGHIVLTARILRAWETVRGNMEHVQDTKQPGPASHIGHAAAPDRARVDADLAYNDSYLLAPIAHLLIGFDTSILQVNLAGADMLGISRSRPFCERLRAFVVGPFLPDFDRFISQAINSDAAERCNLELRGKAGQPSMPVTLCASVDNSGQACRVTIELASGKTEALERSEERLRRIVHSAEEGIWEIESGAPPPGHFRAPGIQVPACRRYGAVDDLVGQCHVRQRRRLPGRAGHGVGHERAPRVGGADLAPGQLRRAD